MRSAIALLVGSREFMRVWKALFVAINRGSHPTGSPIPTLLVDHVAFGFSKIPLRRLLHAFIDHGECVAAISAHFYCKVFMPRIVSDLYCRGEWVSSRGIEEWYNQRKKSWVAWVKFFWQGLVMLMLIAYRMWDLIDWIISNPTAPVHRLLRDIALQLVIVRCMRPKYCPLDGALTVCSRNKHKIVWMSSSSNLYSFRSCLPFMLLQHGWTQGCRVEGGYFGAGALHNIFNNWLAQGPLRRFMKELTCGFSSLKNLICSK